MGIMDDGRGKGHHGPGVCREVMTKDKALEGIARRLFKEKFGEERVRGRKQRHTMSEKNSTGSGIAGIVIGRAYLLDRAQGGRGGAAAGQRSTTKATSGTVRAAPSNRRRVAASDDVLKRVTKDLGRPIATSSIRHIMLLEDKMLVDRYASSGSGKEAQGRGRVDGNGGGHRTEVRRHGGANTSVNASTTWSSVAERVLRNLVGRKAGKPG